MRLPCAAQRLPAIGRQEKGASESQGTCQARAAAQGLGHAQDTRGHEDGVRHRAEQHHAAHVLTAQALAQHERVLRPDGDDEAEAQRQALHEDRDRERRDGRRGHEGPSSLPVPAHEDTTSSLRSM